MTSLSHGKKIQMNEAHHFSSSTPFNPVDYVSGISFPDRIKIKTKAWTGHVPFAMQLISMIRPEMVVELGTHLGMSYCAMCQAVKELGLSTRCHAVDTWNGDLQAGLYEDDVYNDLKSYHDARYSNFSEMIRSTFDDALPSFNEKTIDLLHIDGFHSYEAVKHDFETWLPKMSSRGVVIIHDTNVRDNPTFGVWRFWDEIRTHYPSFEFLHSHGLGILAVGKEIPEAVLKLTNASLEEIDQIQFFYAQQGKLLFDFQTMSLDLDGTQALLVKTQIELAQTKAYYSRREFRFVENLRIKAKSFLSFFKPRKSN